MEAVKKTTVTCPGCGLSRSMDLSRVPDNVHQLVCPKCRRQFELRSAVADWVDPYYRMRRRHSSSRSRRPERPPVIPASLERTSPAPKVDTPTYEPAEDVLTLSYDDEPEDFDISASPEEIGLAASPAPAGTPGGISWEDKSTGLGRYILTALRILLTPKSFFKAMAAGQGLKRPHKFAVFTVSIVGLVWAAQYAIYSMQYGDTPLTQTAPMLIVPVILMPLIYSILIFIQAILFYVLLTMFNAVKCSYQAVFRLVAYSAAAKLWLMAPQDWIVLPMAWTAVLYFTGLREISLKKMGAPAIILSLLLAVAEIYGLNNSWRYLYYVDFFRLW